MQINSISSVQTNTTFGQVVLGRGGAKRLVRNMSPDEARDLIRQNFIKQGKILITERNIEVIPPSEDRIYNVSRVIAQGDGFTDIEVYEHGMRNTFRINKAVDQKKYGENNVTISLAEAIANEMNKNYNWTQCLLNKEDIADTYSKAADELTTYYKMYGTF